MRNMSRSVEELVARFAHSLRRCLLPHLPHQVSRSLTLRITLASSTSPRSVLSVFIKIMFSHIQMLTLVGAL